jgi:hypothetical protein
MLCRNAAKSTNLTPKRRLAVASFPRSVHNPSSAWIGGVDGVTALKPTKELFCEKILSANSGRKRPHVAPFQGEKGQMRTGGSNLLCSSNEGGTANRRSDPSMTIDRERNSPMFLVDAKVWELRVEGG